MPTIYLDGLEIAYDIVGDGPRDVAITPGGRFSKDAAGIRELAGKLAEGGCRVLVWDRPNCGASSLRFEGPSETVQNADTLAALLRAIGFGPALLVGGSGGGRETLVTAIRHPDVVERAFVLWLTGGAIGLSSLPSFYCADAVMAASVGGMAAVADLPGWREPLERRPANREWLLAQDPDAFIARMHVWAQAYFPLPGVPIPCVTRADLAGIAVPVHVLRSGASDPHHLRATSEAVVAAIPHATLGEPPWDDREWVRQLSASMAGETGLFARWPLLSFQILAFAGDRA